MSGTEQQPTPDAGQPNPETILNPNFRAVHGRIYLAATDDHPDTIEVVLDPEKRDIPFTLKPPTEKFISEPQRYNNAVWGLSKMERKATWDSVIQAHGFEYAMDEWNAQVRSSIDLTQIQSRKDLIKHYTGKESGHSPEEIRTTLYDRYCNGTSDVTGFVIEALKIPNVSEEDVKWLAEKLFGSDSAVVATKIMELEKSIENTGELATFELLFGISEQDRKAKFERINDPLPDEVELLSKLKAGYDRLSPEEKTKIKAAQPAQQPPRRPPEDRAQEKRKSKAETTEDAKASVDFEHTLLRSRMVVTDRDGEKYYVKKTVEGQPSPGVANLEDLYHLVRISDGEELSPMKKGELIAIIQSQNPEYIRDPLERKKVKSKSASDDGIYILQTHYDEHTDEDRIWLCVKFKKGGGGWDEVIIRSYLKNDFGRIFQDEYEIVDDRTPTRQPTISPDSGPTTLEQLNTQLSAAHPEATEPQTIPQPSEPYPSPQPTPQSQTPQTTSPEPEAQPSSQTEEEPKDLLQAVNKRIEKASGSEVNFEASSGQLEEYLKSLELPFGASIENANVRRSGNQLSIDASVKTTAGGAKLSAITEEDGSGGIRVVRHDIKLPLLARAFKGKIEQYVVNLDQEIRKVMNSNINPAWEVSSFYLGADDKFGVNFRKKRA